MKKFLFVLLMLINNESFAQWYLGYTPEKAFVTVVKQGGNSDPVWTKSPKGTTVLGWHTDSLSSSSLLYFSESKISNVYVIIPDNSTALNFYVTYFNQKYVKESDKEWKCYTKDGKIIRIELFNTKNGFSFYFTLI